ncbi:hypothetical protein [Methylobacterium sp. CM6257]
MNPITAMLVAALLFCGLAIGAFDTLRPGWLAELFAGLFLGAAMLVALSLKVANAWEKFVILRAGKLQGVRGPG